MSRTATDWAFAQELPAMQKLVLLALTNRHNSETGRCDPSLVRVAKDCGIGKTTVQRILVALTERGLLTRTRRQVEGVFTSTTYGFQMGVGPQRTNVDAQETNPVGAEETNGRTAADQGVGPQRTINQKDETGREPKEETPAERRQKLTVIRPTSKSPSIAIPEVPTGMPSEPWLNYVAVRKEIKKPLTPTAAKMLVRKIEKLGAEGHSAALLLDKATERQWQTVYPADDTKAPPRKVEFVVMTPEEAAASWEREVAANV